MDNKQYHWYTTKNRVPESDKTVIVFGKCVVGFLTEPSYAAVEKHDLREEGHGSLEMLTERSLKRAVI